MVFDRGLKKWLLWQLAEKVAQQGSHESGLKGIALILSDTARC